MTDLSHWAQNGLRARRPRLPQLPALSLGRLVPFTGFVVPATLLVAWYGVTAAHWAPDQILPAPAAVWEAFGTLTRSGDLQNNLGISLSRVVYGFGAGALAGLLLGAGM